jgi:CRP/FNR family transcriptional regulator, cyclic AMP receptor protein
VPVITREVLLDYIGQQPEFALELMGRLIRRARLATESARNVALIDVYGRLVRFLNQLALDPNAQG